MILQLKFPAGNWTDYSHLLIYDSVTIRERLMNKECKSVVDTLSFQLKYDQTLQAALFTATDWILVDLDTDASADLFHGAIAPTFGLRKRTNVQPISIEAVDNSYLLDEPINTSFNYPSAIGGTAYAIFDADDSANNVVWEMLEDAGYTPADDIASGASDITTTVEYFQGTKDTETYRHYLDTLLSEYGWVFFFNAAGEFDVAQWDKDTVTSSETIDEDIEINKVNVQEDGFEVEFAQTAQDSDALLYRANLPITETNGQWKFTGEAIANNDYWPPDGDINDIFQNYVIKWLDKPYLSRETRLQNKDISLIAADASDSTVSFTADSGIAISSSTYESKRAKVLMRNTSGATASIYNFEIRGVALYRKTRRFTRAPNTSTNPKKYVSRFLHDETLATVEANATRFARARNLILANGQYEYVWTDRTSRSVGTVCNVNMTDPSINQDVIIIDRRYNPDRTTYRYTAQGITAYTTTTVSKYGEAPDTTPTKEQTAKDLGKTGVIGEQSAIGVNESNDDPSDGDVRIYMGKDPEGSQGASDPVEFAIKEYNGNDWETRFSAGMRSGGNVADAFVSGFFKAGEGALSSPGRVWREGTNSFAGSVRGMDFGNGVIVAGSTTSEIAVSDDGGVSFGADKSNNHTLEINVIRFGNDTWLAAGESGELSLSTDDGATWGSLISNDFDSSTNNDEIQDADYDPDNDVWVIVGGPPSTAAWSDDSGATWNAPTTIPASTEFIKVRYLGSDVWCALDGGDGYVYLSSDGGDTWSGTEVESTAGYGGEAMGYSDGVVVAAFRNGTNYTMWRSDDRGTTWESVTWTATDAVQFIADGLINGMFITNNGRISFDYGRTWEAGTSYGGGGINAPNALCGAYDSTNQIIAVGAGSGETHYSTWLEAGAGIVEHDQGADGYIQFSTGLIVQWGTATHSSLAVTNTSGNIYRSAILSAKNYPKSVTTVLQAPIPQVYSTANAVRWTAAATTAPTTSAWGTYYVLDSASSTDNTTVHFFMVGIV